MRIDAVCVGLFQSNCYLVADQEAGTGVLIDPGDEADRVLDMIRRRGVRVTDILITHAHIDHVGALDEVRETLRAAVHMNEKDLSLFGHISSQGLMFGVQLRQPRPPESALTDGQVLARGSLSMKIIETPGHSPGGVSVLLEGPARALFTGDTLFAGSIGRTDLWGGSYEQLIDSIRNRLLPLGDDLRVYPGHGPPTTIGEESRGNPFLQGDLRL